MNGSATASSLRVASRKLFAAKGFKGASVRDITGAARANLGAITYHFGSKEALYHAVLSDVFDDLADRVERAAAPTGSAETRLRAIVASLFAFFRASPDAPLLVLREIAGGGSPPAPVVPRVRRVLGAITGVIRDGQDRGELRQLEPYLGAFTLMSQCVWFAVMGRHLPTMLSLDVPDGALAGRMEAHIAEVVTRALR